MLSSNPPDSLKHDFWIEKRLSKRNVGLKLFCISKKVLIAKAVVSFCLVEISGFNQNEMRLTSFDSHLYLSPWRK